MIFRYDSIAELRRTYINLNAGSGSFAQMNPFNLSWYNNETEADTLLKAELGDTALVAKAEEAISQLETNIETPRKVWERNVAGAYCVVPDVLAGLPTPMRRMIHQREDTNPITIFVDIGSSGGIEAATLTKRGTIILALVIALTRIRPVQLYQLHCGNGEDGETITISEINTYPLDLATACYVLTSAGFARRLVYNVAAERNKYSGLFPSTFSTYKQNDYYDKLKPRLVSDVKNCLIIPKAIIHDELLTQPLIWLNKQIQHFTQEQQDEQ